MRFLLLLSPTFVVGLEIPFSRCSDGMTVMTALASATGEFPGFDRVWLSLSDGASIGPGRAVAGTYSIVDREFHIRTLNSTQSVIYPRCSMLTQINDMDDMLDPHIRSVQLGIGPGSPIMNLGGSVDVVDGRLLIGQTERDFVQNFCQPGSLITIPYYRDTNVASAISLRIRPQVSVIMNYAGRETVSWFHQPAVLTNDLESGFDIPSQMYNEMVHIIYSESMYMNAEGDTFMTFANCERIRLLLPSISFAFIGFGHVSVAAEDYTEMMDGDLCTLQLKSVPSNMPIILNPFRLAGMNVRLTENALGICDDPYM